jgi:Ig-like domain CHU_C associated
MKVVYFIPARKSLNSVSKISLIRIFVLMISFFVMNSFQSFSNELDMKSVSKGYAETPAKRKETLPKSVNRKIDFNYISLNTLLKTSYCTGESSSLYADAQGIFNPGNIFSVVLSDSIGSFSNPTIIGTLESSSSGVQTINFRFPIGVALGTGYRIRIVASNPLTTSPDNNFDIAVTTIPVPASTNQVICAGQSLALAATCSTGTLKWYKNATGDTLLTSTTVSPTETTNYYPACEDGTTCYSRRKVHTVTVNYLTGVSLAPSFSTCAGSNIDLPVVTSQTNLSYAWTGPNSFTATTKIASITNLTATKTGTYSVTVTSPNSCFVTATTVLSIGTALPNLSISGDTAVCYNGTINLTAESGGISGVTYSWTGPQSFTATGENISRSAFTTNGQGLTTYHDGVYRVTATNPTTGCTGTVSVNVHVGNKPNNPVIPASASICEGTNHNIVVGFGGASFQSYAWTGPNGFTSTSTATCNTFFQCTDAIVSLNNFSTANVGTYSVIGYFTDINNKTCSINASTSVSIKTKPEVTVTSNSAVCLGQNLNFTTNTTSAISSYSWSGPNNFTSSIQNPTVSAATGSASGTYTLVVVGQNQCVTTVNATASVTEAYPPVVSPTAQVVLSNSITLTATGCAGTVDWYKSSDNLPVAMPVSPIVQTLYYAKCSLSGCVSEKSNDITVSIGAPIAISVKSGDWNDKTTWNINRVPLAIDSVIIDENHVVVIYGQYSAKWMSFRGNGTISFGATVGNLNLLGNPPPPKTETPTLLTVSETQITYSGYTVGTTLKLYKDGKYTNLTIVAGNGTWTGLNLASGTYTITARDPDLSESLPSNAIQFTPTTVKPTLLTVTGTAITFSDYTNGTTIKLYKDGVYTNLSTVVNSNTWSGLTLTSGSYTITSTESDKLESAQSNAIQYSSLPQTGTPTLLAVYATYITYTNYTPGAVFKLYRNGVFTGDTFVSNGNEWTGLNLVSGLYTYTATESGKTESAQSNAIQFTQPNGITATPTLVTVTGSVITFSNYTNGATIKLYKNGTYIYQAHIANNGQWTGLSLSTGLYTISATESGKYESAQSNSIQYTATTPQTSTPTLSTVTGSQITFSGYTNGATIKLYKDGVYTNLSTVANSGTWSGLTLTSGEYTITATESGKTESAQSNVVQYSTLPQTATPTLLSVNATFITYTNYTPGAMFKLYKNGVFTGNTFVSNGNEWTGLNLSTGLYTYTATESGKSESAQSNAIQYTQPNGQTAVPTLLSIAGGTITFSGYTTGTTIKLYRNGSYINQSYVANYGQWSGLNLATGSYTITATDAGKYESPQSNAIQYTASSTQTATPVLLTVSGTRISYSNYTTGTTLKLYKNGVFANLTYVANSNEWTGLNLTTGTYSITATESGKTESGQSNSEQYTVPSANVVIIEPNKPQYFFSNGHAPSYYNNNANLPVIFTNQAQYDPVNDMVWLKNNKIKIGINLKRGGQLAWASLLDATTNLVYNGYDGGFQVTLDAYQRKDGYTQGGEVAGSGIPGSPVFSYNVTQGGDYLNHAVSLIDYHAIPDGYYVKVRPIHYPLNAKMSETYIEAWYTIIRQSVKIQYRYTSFRTDGQWNGSGFDGAAVPACFIVNTLNRYKTYTGNAPWSFAPAEAGVLPIQNMGGTPLSRQATEHWGMVYDPQRPNTGIGVYNDTDATGSSLFTFKQLEVYPGNGPGTEFTNGFTYFHAFNYFNNLTNRGSYTKDLTAYLMLGTEYEIRAEAYRISGHEANIPQY